MIPGFVEVKIEHQQLVADQIINSVAELCRVGRENVSRQRIEARLSGLNEDWQDFVGNHKALLSDVAVLDETLRAEVKASSYFSTNTFSRTREAFLESFEKMTTLLDDVQNESQSSSHWRGDPSTLTLFSGNHQLPKLELPKFDGNHTEWLTFRDMFSSLVFNNSSLSPVVKLQYLKNSLSGSAASFLKHTSLTNDNFEKAWKDLIAYYDNTRVLVDSNLHALFSIKPMQTESATELEELYTMVQQSIRSLEMLNQPVTHWDAVLIFLTTRCFDQNTIKAWELELGSSTEYPKWDRLDQFILSRMRSLQALERASSSNPKSQAQSGSKSQRTSSDHLPAKSHPVQQITSSIKRCPICNSDHQPWKCPEYSTKSLDRKVELIKQKGLCYNCLGSHIASACPSPRRCQKCGTKHHTSIHGFEPRPQRHSSLPSNSLHVTPEPNSEPTSKLALHASPTPHVSRPVSVLLATALAKVELRPGHLVDVRLLVDQGSEVSLVTEFFVQRHHIPRQKSYLSIIGAGKHSAGHSRGTVALKLKSNFDPNFSCLMSAEILPQVTGNLPSIRATNPSWPHLIGIDLADPNFCDPSSVDIILGSDVYSQIIQSDLKKGKTWEPIAQRTSLGWIISGPVSQAAVSQSVQAFHCSVEKDWYDLVERFWRQEEVLDTKPTLSPSEQECETHFISNVSRTESGRYVVRLPFRSSAKNIGQTKTIALKSLNRLTRHFDSDAQLFKDYDSFLQEYHELGHMIPVTPQASDTTPLHYLPHHGVPHHSGSSNKIRVVFNASCRSDNGVSLNDVLHTGAKLQIDLFDVLLWFRKYRYVFSTDIEKMYRQISVHTEDWKFQNILWKDNLGNIVTYALTTVTYGLACAPFLALRTMVQLLNDEGGKFPLAIPVLTKGRYVDDIFGGGDTIQEVQQVISHVRQLCLAGQFPLRKWISNTPKALQDVCADHQLPTASLPFDQSPSISTLGLSWRPSEDVFHFSTESPPESTATKRTISSQIARLFDPMGFIAPVTIRAKIILQELWALGIGWDDIVPQEVATRWQSFIQQLCDLHSLNIPRWIGITSTATMQVHGFADASQSGMAAVVYIRTTDHNQVTTSLICSKTKVAPLKRMTIPRLELIAATLLCRLTAQICKTLELEFIPIFMWTDSSIAHTWINTHPSKWREFVHNRVCLIQETLPQAKWKLVPGLDNPADCASRGLTPAELLKHHIWWKGPSWLLQEPNHWPGINPQTPLDNQLEIRQTVSSHVTQQPTSITWDLLSRYSDLTRLLRITALCQRAAKKLTHHYIGSISVPLTPEDLLYAKYYWVRQCQMRDFKVEIDLLSTAKPLPKSNPLIRLTPFIDEVGILRVGGRLSNALISYENKHPFILSRHCPLSNLIIADAHTRTLHGTTQGTLAFIRTTCWILGGRAPIRSFILHCVRCTILRRKSAQQLMGQLPSSRVTEVPRPFVNSGVDYAGPFNIKKWPGRAVGTYKGFIALFVCQATSAIHLEIATDYTAEAFMAAYRRFTSRRGICKTLTSDCGTNFKGADAELKRLFCRASSELEKLSSLIANDGTEWKFNPPGAPHFGGKWEAGVKSVKYHLRRTIGDHLLTYEEMSTLLTQIEAVLNSRPILPLTDDPDDLSVLTPGHFLIGQPLNIVPEPSLTEVKLNRLSRWQRLRHMMESFWAKWSRECLQRFQAVYKWNESSNSITVGKLVLIIDERYPPTKWPLGRVIQVHPGKDGLVRVVTVKTQYSTVTRPVVKLCPLPIPVESE